MSEDKRRLPTATNPGEVSAEVDAFLRAGILVEAGDEIAERRLLGTLDVPRQPDQSN